MNIVEDGCAFWAVLLCVVTWFIPLQADTPDFFVLLVVFFRAMGLITLVFFIALFVDDVVVPEMEMVDLGKARKVEQWVLPGMFTAWALILILSYVRIANAPPL